MALVLDVDANPDVVVAFVAPIGAGAGGALSNLWKTSFEIRINASSTLISLNADVSKKAILYSLASASPSSIVTA